ncbi:MAG TPA: NUDIX domain-containing protein [Sphingomonas sp.]|jgi:8-oxo-dGTP pyrophosphatase MutT (NUDIX family)|uniref:NUDIX hydrolase n=1 Tax=Sphingomonas sp. TaxID=28214 RepID=UPI002ED97071
MTNAIPAATLIVMRDRAGFAPEILMVERAKAMAFAGGALVFPGGRIDPGDHALAADSGSGLADAAARIAAIRETIEEAGLAIGLTPRPDTAAVAAMRDGLHAGSPMDAMMADAGFALDLAALVPFARWLPAHAHARIFDTYFYLARAPAGASPTVDATENVRLIWTSAADVLDQADAGHATIIYPTRRNLERLARFADFDAAVADAIAHPIRTITPFVEHREGADHLCIPDDLGYPVTSEVLSGSLRG